MPPITTKPVKMPIMLMTTCSSKNASGDNPRITAISR